MTCVEHEQAVSTALSEAPGATSKSTAPQRDLIALTKRRARKLRRIYTEQGVQQAVALVCLWQLKKRLREYRGVLTEAWSEATCYQPFVQLLQSGKSPSIGQCGVSSAWLISKLSWHRRLRANYCVGYVVFDGGRGGKSEFHCWVEIGDSARRLVIDLTFDQFGYRDRRKVLCAPHETLMSESIEYQRERRMRFGNLRDDDVWQRYQILLEATSKKRTSDRQRGATLTQR